MTYNVSSGTLSLYTTTTFWREKSLSAAELSAHGFYVISENVSLRYIIYYTYYKYIAECYTLPSLYEHI